MDEFYDGFDLMKDKHNSLTVDSIFKAL